MLVEYFLFSKCCDHKLERSIDKEGNTDRLTKLAKENGHGDWLLLEGMEPYFQSLIHPNLDLLPRVCGIARISRKPQNSTKNKDSTKSVDHPNHGSMKRGNP